MPTDTDHADGTDPTTEQEAQTKPADRPDDDEDSTARNSPPAVFKLTSSVSALQTIVNAVDPIVDECRIAVDDSGFQIRASDPSQVEMVDLQIDAQSFKHFESGTGTLGVNYPTLSAFGALRVGLVRGLLVCRPRWVVGCVGPGPVQRPGLEGELTVAQPRGTFALGYS